MKGLIYKYTFADGKVYIGQTRRNPEIRKREHLDKLVGPVNPAFWAAYKKYGEPEYKELLTIEKDNIEALVFELNRAETFFIMFFNAADPKYGYNVRTHAYVGTGSKTFFRKKFNETFERIREKKCKIWEKALNKIFYTKKRLTDDEIYLIKEKYRDENVFQKYIDIIDLNHLSKFDSDGELGFWVEEALDNVRKLLLIEAEQEAYSWTYQHYEELLHQERSKNAIVQIDKEGKIVKEYYSLNEICEVFNVQRADNVLNVLHGKQKTAYGFFWKYKKDMKK